MSDRPVPEWPRFSIEQLRLTGVGLLINSALYLTGVFVAALAEGNKVALLLTLSAFACCYLSYLQQINMMLGHWRGRVAAILTLIVTALSIMFGTAAGIALIFGD